MFYIPCLIISVRGCGLQHNFYLHQSFLAELIFCGRSCVIGKMAVKYSRWYNVHNIYFI